MTMEDHLEGRFNKECPHTPTMTEVRQRMARILEHVKDEDILTGNLLELYRKMEEIEFVKKVEKKQ